MSYQKKSHVDYLVGPFVGLAYLNPSLIILHIMGSYSPNPLSIVYLSTGELQGDVIRMTCLVSFVFYNGIILCDSLKDEVLVEIYHFNKQKELQRLLPNS